MCRGCRGQPHIVRADACQSWHYRRSTAAGGPHPLPGQPCAAGAGQQDRFPGDTQHGCVSPSLQFQQQGGTMLAAVNRSCHTGCCFLPSIMQAARGTLRAPTSRGCARPTGRATPAPPPRRRSSMPISRYATGPIKKHFSETQCRGWSGTGVASCWLACCCGG